MITAAREAIDVAEVLPSLRLDAVLDGAPPGPIHEGDYVIALYDNSSPAKVVSRRVLDAIPDYYADVLSLAAESLEGGQLTPRQDDRLLHLSIPPQSRYLAVFRVIEITPPAGRRRSSTRAEGEIDGAGWRFTVQPLVAYALPQGEGAPGLTSGLNVEPPLPSPGDATTITFPEIVPFPPPGWDPTNPERCGASVGNSQFHNSGPPGRRFNIVILGEGFQQAELPRFDARATTLASGLLRMEPFASHTSKLNIYIGRAFSTDSGTTNWDPNDRQCQTPGPSRCTFFEIQSCWVSGVPCIPSNIGYMGSPRPEWLYAAADEIVAMEWVDLIIVIANIDTRGGSAFRSQRIAFVGNFTPDEEFINLAAHEAAHVIAALGEEYISIIPWSGTRNLRNVVDRDARENAWWKPLARVGEVDPSGRFRHVYDCPADPQNAPCTVWVNEPSTIDNNDPMHLGLYWGASFIDPGEDPCVAFQGWNSRFPYVSQLGRNFFRGRARCRMRLLRWEFCRVCSAAMVEQLWLRTIRPLLPLIQTSKW
ncbi:MAG: hypothetical protein ACREOU_10170 [Candidatus Eiseniibacteriota bacterium]